MTFSLIAYRDSEKIVFGIKKSILEPIKAYMEQMDAEVLHQQRTTGSYYGRWSTPKAWFVYMDAQEAKGRGKAHPYFGQTTSSVHLGYELVFEEDGVLLQANHLISDEPVSVFLPENDVERIVDFADSDFRFQGDYDLLSINHKPEFEKLEMWEHWHAESAFTPRYAYRFSQTDIGTATTITDRLIQVGIDITEYDSW